MHKSNTSELALETLIQKALTGHNISETKADTTSGNIVSDCREQYLTGNRYYVGDPQDFKMKDALLNSIDLSTYGLERVKLNTSIELDSSESELDPQNPNSRGAHSGDEDKDPLDLIIKSFNERYFQGWDATPEEQRVKFVNIAKHIQAHPDFKAKILNNSDSQTKELAFAKIFDDVINKQRKNELDLYRLMTQDAGFKQAMQDTIKRILGA